MAEQAVPDEILQFNAFLVEQQQAEQQERRVRKADAAKQQAAERVRDVMADPDSSREARTEAEAAYHEALEVHRAATGGEPEPEPEPEPEGETPADDAEATDGAEASDADAEVAETQPEAAAAPEPAEPEATEVPPAEPAS